ncbi:MAG: LytR C-terminal domain-containing protein [Gaiellales bacterium]
MEHLLRLTSIERPVHQWRAAALALTAVAAIELILLVAAGGALLGRSKNHALVLSTRTSAQAKVGTAPAKAKPQATKPGAATMLVRRKIGVLVLNGNGRSGAAGVAASRVTHRGYRVRGVGNAPSMDYVHSIVMYRPGFRAEGIRLARDLGVRIVGPLDGIRPKQLHGAHTVLILGA